MARSRKRRRARRRARAGAARRSPRGCASSRCCWRRTCPRSDRATLLARARRATARWPSARSGATQRWASGSAGDRVAVPEGRRSASRVIDSHTHLDLCEPPDAELVADGARRPGVTRMLTVGIDGASLPRRARRRRGLPAGVRRDRAPPDNARRGFDDADLRRAARARAHERCVAIGETGLDYYRDARAARRPASARSRRRSSSRASRQAARDPHRAAAEETLEQLARRRRRPAAS